MTPDTHMKFLFNSVKKKKIFTYFNFPGQISLIHIDELIKIIEFYLDNETLNETHYIHDNYPISLGKIFKEFHKYYNRKYIISLPKFIINIIIKMRLILPFKIKTLFMNTMFAEETFFKQHKNLNVKKKFPKDINYLSIN